MRRATKLALFALLLTRITFASDAADRAAPLNADAAVKADPSDRNALFQRAWALALLGRRAESDRDYASLVAADPKDSVPFVNHGSLAFANGNYHTAIADYTHAMVRGNHTPLVWHYRGLAFLVTGNIESANVDFKYWIQADANSAEAYAHRAFVYWRLDDGDNEKAALAQAKQLDPNQSDRWDKIDDGAEFPIPPKHKLPPMEPLDCPEHQQAIALNNEGLQWLPRDEELAIRKFESAEAADPVWGVPWCNHSIALVTYVAGNGGGLTRAFGYLSHGYMLDPRLEAAYEPKLLTFEHPLEQMGGLTDTRQLNPTPDARARINAIQSVPEALAEGKRLRDTNGRAQVGDALYAYFHAMQLDPMNSEARLRRAIIFRDLQQPRLDMSTYDLSAAVRVDPANWEAYRLRAVCFGDAKEFASAINDVSIAITLKSDVPGMYLERAMYTLAGDGNADADFTAAQKLDPTHFDTAKQQVLAEVEQVKQEIREGQEAARAMAETMSKLRSLDRQAAYGRASAAEARGDTDTARMIRETIH